MNDRRVVLMFPPVLRRIMRRVARDAANLSWPYAIAIAIAHATSVAIGYIVMGETELVSGLVQFIYFYMVTGSTVGYGDFSPSSETGKLFTALWVVPGAISIFAFLIGKVIASISARFRSKMDGLGNFSLYSGHIVILGYNRGQTEQFIGEIEYLRGSHEIIIVSTDDLSGLQDGWEFVRATALSNAPDLERAGIAGADYVVVLGSDDEESMAACLAISSIKLQGHCVAYFREPAPSRLISSHCPEIELVTSTSVEQVARALSDPGASEVLRRLVSTHVGATLSSITLQGAPTITVGALMEKLIRNHDATLVGYRSRECDQAVLSLKFDTELHEGQTIYYIASERIPNDTMIAT